MDTDGALERFLDDYERYADIINGTVFKGEQRLTGADFSEYNSKSVTKTFSISKDEQKVKNSKSKKHYRDLIKKVALGVNFAVIGIENQSEVHYLMPLRVMDYSAAEYKRQAARIKKNVRRRKDISKAEFLSGFRKDDRLMPCMIIVLFYGDKWDGSKDLHGVLDFTDIPEEIKKYIPNYPINLVNIKEIENIDVFKTDVKQVFNFIKYSGDKKKLRMLVENDETYRHMDEDAYDVVSLYTKVNEFVGIGNYKDEGGRIDMCRALEDWSKEERALGREEGKDDILSIISRMINSGESLESIKRLSEDGSFLNEMRSKYLCAVN